MYKLAKSTESMDKKVNNLVNLFKYKFTTNQKIFRKVFQRITYSHKNKYIKNVTNIEQFIIKTNK